MMDELKKQGNPSDHLANERTFLAWMRTSIGIMAFGFVVVKFSLFIKQISLILGKENIIQSKGYSGIMGIALVAVGSLTAVFSYIRYKQTEKQLNNGYYKHSSLLITILTALIFLVSVFLVVYLINSI
jgi:putative membrane protein